jgi:hypothetical protein
MPLTDDQNKAIIMLNDFNREPALEYQEAYLFGGAGVGKSYVIVEYLKQNTNLNIAFCSPTHKARKILDDMLRNANLEYSASTVASFLHLKPVLNIQSGDTEFSPSNKTYQHDYSTYDLVFLDEASQYNASVVMLCKRFLKKIVWVGDHLQLSPVSKDNKEQYSIPCDFLLDYPEYPYRILMQTVVRYGGEILDFALKIRDNIHSAVIPKHNHYYEQVIVKDLKMWNAHAVNYFRTPQFKENSDYCKVVVFRNEVVNNLNTYYRDILFGNDAINTYLEGEVLIVKEPVIRKIESENGTVQTQTILQVSQEVLVWDVEIATDDDGYLWYFLTVEDENGRTHNLQVIHEYSVKQWNNKLCELIEIAKKEPNNQKRKQYWILRDEFKNKNDVLIHSYCINANNAQGSSYDVVFCHTADIMQNYNNLDRNRRLYVSVTRAKQKLYML